MRPDSFTLFYFIVLIEQGQHTLINMNVKTTDLDLGLYSTGACRIQDKQTDLHYY